jgi:hypothetical protein
MRMNLPEDFRVDTGRLAGCFNNTSATYKFYWLLAVLAEAEKGQEKIDKTSLFAQMVAHAWYTVNDFKISFGSEDKLERAISRIRELEGLTEESQSYLPKMITDITLEHPDRKVILDTKFYQSGGINDRQTFESANLYQLHAYVSQLARHAQGDQGNNNSRPHSHDDRAEGMLLYATVGENNYTHRFAMPPHQMTVATVDLNMPWQGIEQRLLEVVGVG